MQEEANFRLQEISMDLKAIPNIGNSYMEYMSALIYVIYENMQKIDEILETRDIVYLIKSIEQKLYIIREKDPSRRLFKNIRFLELVNTENYMTLKNVIAELRRLILELKGSKKVLAESFEYIIMQAAQNSELTSKSKTFYTPKGLVKTMVKLLDIKSNCAIYNPACATGNFIIESVKNNHHVYVFGEEEDISNYNICMTNLWLHDIYDKVINEDGLQKIPEVDYAIANPPFELQRLDDPEIIQNRYLYNYITSKTNTYVKYIIKMLNNIHELYGKMAIILPQGFLFKQIAIESILRRELIEKNYIDAIIRLPEKMFYNTKIPVIILLIDKAKRADEVLFIDASNEYHSKRKINILTVEDQEKIVDIYRNRYQIQNYSYLATFEEIKKNKFNLNIDNYIRIQRKEEIINKVDLEEKVYNLEREKYNIQQKIREIIDDIK